MRNKQPHSKQRSPRISKARLLTMIEEAPVDAHDESEQVSGWHSMLEQTLALPFKTTVLGAEVEVTQLDIRDDDTLVAMCVRGRQRQAIPLFDLPLPTPRPRGSEWIDAYRLWLQGR